MRSRTRAREAALKYLYEYDLRKGDGCLPAGEYLSRLRLPPPVDAFARELIEGVLSNLESLDRGLERAARNWRLARMAALDRNVLRIGAFEITRREDVPGQVAINEAVEIARRYGSGQSAAFVNGILDRILADSGRPKQDAGGEASREETGEKGRPQGKCSD